MTLIVQLSPTEEDVLRSVAHDRGIAPEELARILIANLSVSSPTSADQSTQRVSPELRAMGMQALREHALGKTEEFPI